MSFEHRRFIKHVVVISYHVFIMNLHFSAINDNKVGRSCGWEGSSPTSKR